MKPKHVEVNKFHITKIHDKKRPLKFYYNITISPIGYFTTLLNHTDWKRIKKGAILNDLMSEKEKKLLHKSEQKLIKKTLKSDKNNKLNLTEEKIQEEIVNVIKESLSQPIKNGNIFPDWLLIEAKSRKKAQKEADIYTQQFHNYIRPENNFNVLEFPDYLPYLTVDKRKDFIVDMVSWIVFFAFIFAVVYTGYSKFEDYKAKRDFNRADYPTLPKISSEEKVEI